MNFPSLFVARMQAILGNQSDSFFKSLLNTPPVSVRKHPLKNSSIVGNGKVAWCGSGAYLNERPVFTLDPLFHAGTYYVQEASSMFIEQAVNHLVQNKAGLNVLDLCAAPGGKSTHLLSLLDESCMLVSNEMIRSRANILSENIAKWGYPNSVVTNNTPNDFKRLPNFFDIILADAPCSGEGMFRKDPNAVSEWSEANVQLCADRQRSILSDVWESLKDGGLLIYSTCTFNRIENEGNADWIVNDLGGVPQRIPLNEEWGIVETTTPSGAFGYHFYPHLTKGEGFYLAAFKKQGVEQEQVRQTIKKVKKNTPVDKVIIPSDALSWLTDRHEWQLSMFNSQVKALRSEKAEAIKTVEQQLYILSSGVTLGEVKGKDFIPSPSLALSTQLNIAHIQTVELSLDDAIRFLRKDTVDIGATPKGYVLVCYKNTPLGWLKQLGNRSNNLYPNEWRIRMQVDQRLESL